MNRLVEVVRRERSKLNKDDYEVMAFLIVGGVILTLLFTIIVLLYDTIMKIIIGVTTCYVTILLYRFLVGFCFVQTKLNQVRTFSLASNKRFIESKKGNRDALVIGFTMPTKIECIDLLKMIPKLIPVNL